MDLDGALGANQAAVRAHRAEYAILTRLQAGMLRMPIGLVPLGVRLFASGPLSRLARRAYWNVADPNRLEIEPGVASHAHATPDQCRTAP